MQPSELHDQLGEQLGPILGDEGPGTAE